MRETAIRIHKVHRENAENLEIDFQAYGTRCIASCFIDQRPRFSAASLARQS
jgi:hypothetical protein